MTQFHQILQHLCLCFTILCNLLCHHFTTPLPFQHLHFTRPGIYNLYISPFLATCCATISPLPSYFSAYILPVLYHFSNYISPFPYHFSTCISPDLAFTTSIFHHFLQVAVPPFHQTWHL